MKLPLVLRRTHDADMRYAKAAIEALKVRYTKAAMRAAMLQMENETLRKQVAELQAKAAGVH